MANMANMALFAYIKKRLLVKKVKIFIQNNR